MKKIRGIAMLACLSVLMPARESRAQTWTNLGSGMNNTVEALAGDTNGNLYVGGFFTNAGGVAASRIAKWNGASWTNLGSGMNNTVGALAGDTNGNLYAGGSFTNAGGVAASHIAKWNGASWTNLGSGMNNTVEALAGDTNGNLYVGGFFTNAGGVAASRIAKWNGASWTNLGSGMNDYIQALTIDTNGNLYAGGDFTTAGGMAATNIAKWNGASWTNLGNGIHDLGYVYALACDTNGNLYAGGSFTIAGGSAATNIAKWNGTSWTNLGSGIDGPVYALACDTNGNLYAGGFITNAGGVAASRIAKWNGASWTNLGSGMNDYIQALTIDTSGNLYAGGGFTTAGGITANRVAKWSTPGAIRIIPVALSYTAAYGGADPASQLFVITSLGQSGFSFTNTVSYSAGGSGWFNPSAWTGTVPVYGSLTVTGNVHIAGLNAGTYRVTNTISSATATNSPQTLVVTLTVTKADQEIAFPSIPDQAGTNTVHLNATASSGLPVSFSVASGPAQISGGSNLSFTGTGMVSIVAGQAGDANWNPAPNATNTFRVTPIVIGLSAPTGVSASDGEFADKVRLTWYPVASATAYEVWRHTANTASGAVQVVEISGGYTTTYEDTSANADTLFYYWIRAKAVSVFSDTAFSEFSNSEMGYKAPSTSTLSLPANVSASDGVYTNKVRVSYAAVTGAGTYEIWRSDVNLLSSASAVGEATNTLYDDMGVTPNVSYYYWVRAKNPIAVSGFSLPNSGYASLGVGASGSADLALLNLLFLPTVLSAGDQPGAVSVQLVNYGSAALADANTRVAVDFYLSVNTNFGDTDDIWFGDYGCDQILSAGNYATVVLPVSGREGLTIPSGIQAGNYYIFACVRHAPPSTFIDPDMSNNFAMRSGVVTLSAASMGYHLFNDYDGDGKSDLAVYQEASGKWEVMLSGSGYQTTSIVFGGEGYDPALADYDGDGKSDPAVYQEAIGKWEVMLSGSGYATASVVLGGPGYTPAPADYDGDGKSDPAVYRESGGEWQIMLSGSGYRLMTAALGGNGYKAVSADYDGDGKSDLAVYRRPTGDWYFMLSTLQYWTVMIPFGGSGSAPAPADFDGDGKCDPAVYKESSGEWSVMMSLYHYMVAQAEHGGEGYVAVPADYDGDGKGDVVVYNEQAGELKILLSGSGYHQTVVSIGGPGYEPVGVVK